MKKFSAKAFLQKYGKVILTIMSILLMFVFALPTFRNKTADDAQQATAGKLDGKKVTYDELEAAHNDLVYINSLGLFRSNRFQLAGSVLFGMAPEDSDQKLYWYLLRAEAIKYARVFYSEDNVLDAVKNIMVFDNSGIPSTVDSRLGENTSYRALARILSDVDTVETYLEFLYRQPRPVTAFELIADKELRRIEVNFAAIDGIEGWEQAPAPTPEQLQAHFDAYKKTVPSHIPGAPDAPYLLKIEEDPDATPKGNPDHPDRAVLGYPDAVNKAVKVRVGDKLPWDGSTVVDITSRGMILSGGGRTQNTIVPLGAAWSSDQPLFDLQQQPLPPGPPEVNGHRFPFGYQYPDRVKVEYLVFNREEIRKTILADADVMKRAVGQAYEAFEAGAKTRPATAPAAPPTQPAEGVAVAPPTSAPAPATWDNLKDEYIRKQVDLVVNLRLQQMLTWVRNATDAPFKNTDWKANTAVPEPKDWVDYHKLVENSARVSTFNKYQPVLKDTGPNFLSAQQLQDIPGIGRAIFCSAQGPVYTFTTLATKVGELSPPDKQATMTLRNLHVGVEAPEVTDKDGNVYLFRVTAIDKSHEAASIDTDKPGVPDPALKQRVTDDYKKLATFNRRLKDVKDALAATNGAEGALAGLATQYKVDVQKPTAFNRLESEAPLEVQGIHDFLKTAFTLHDPKTPGSVATLSGDGILKIFPMQLNSVAPARPVDFGNAARAYLFNQPDPAVVPFLRSYMELETLAGRLKYVPVNGFPKKKE